MRVTIFGVLKAVMNGYILFQLCEIGLNLSFSSVSQGSPPVMSCVVEVVLLESFPFSMNYQYSPFQWLTCQCLGCFVVS